LAFFVNHLTGFLALLTVSTYLFLYTPLKRMTPLATLAGCVPGALPPVMGWAAVKNEISVEAWILFGILFLWQIPHFLSLAWMYRKDYARAGFRLLTVVDPYGLRTSKQFLIYCSALIPVSISLSYVGATGNVYSTGALLLGIFFLIYAIRFAWCSHRNVGLAFSKANTYSRQLFFASLMYLPTLMFFMTIDKL